MTDSQAATSLGRIGITALLLTALTGCWASKEETISQLQEHLSAYEKLKITPGNAESTIKSVDLLLSTSDQNNFIKQMNRSQEMTLRNAKSKALFVLGCTKTAKTAKENLTSKIWDKQNQNNLTSSQLGSQLEEMEAANQCNREVQSLMGEAESKELTELAKTTSTKYQQVLRREKAQEEEKAAKEKARVAEAERQRCKSFGDLSTQSNQAAHSIEAQGCMTKSQAESFYVTNPSICTTYSDRYPVVCKKVFEEMPGNIPGLNNPYR